MNFQKQLSLPPLHDEVQPQKVVNLVKDMGCILLLVLLPRLLLLLFAILSMLLKLGFKPTPNPTGHGTLFISYNVLFDMKDYKHYFEDGFPDLCIIFLILQLLHLHMNFC